jgi:hypothetical protein
MNDYYPQLLIALSLNFMITPPLSSQPIPPLSSQPIPPLSPQPIPPIRDNKIPRQVAVERFFTADRLSPRWFTPFFLARNNLATLQKNRDELIARIDRRSRIDRCIPIISIDRYRIACKNNIDPDIFIATFEFDPIGRIDEIRMQIQTDL